MNKKFLIGFVIWACLTALFASSFWNKLTYLEYTDIDRGGDLTNIAVDNTHDVVRQDFVMPYDLLHGLSVQIGTFARDNNSEWHLSIIDPETKKVYCSKKFNGSRVADNTYFYLECDKNIRLIRNNRYQIKISAIKVHNDSSLAYYISKDTKDDLTLTVGGKKHNGTLRVKIYGGDADSWWIGFALFLSIIVFQLFVRIYHLLVVKKAEVSHDVVVQSYVVGLVSFLLLSVFCNYDHYLDETDNMVGGWVIAHGSVLYRDYVTQHTPFMYYLCSLFAFAGAKSVEQFRLCYYIVLSAVWALLYLRHQAQFGKKMLLLPVLECIILNSMVLVQPKHPSIMVVSDGVQALCFIALLLEFFKFCQEGTLKWDRAVIVSATVWGSMGSAFLSAYTLAWISLFFIFIEFKRWFDSEVSLDKLVKRYWKLFVAIATPLAIAVMYFASNHSLLTAFDLLYSFNREIYSNYSGIGNDSLAPFVFSSRNFFDITVNHLNSLMNAKASATVVLQLIILITVGAILVSMLRQKQYLTPVLLFGVLCFAGLRGNEDYHFLAAWCIAVMIIALFYNRLFISVSKVGAPIFVIVCVYSLCIYLHTVGDILLNKQRSITDFEHYLVSITSDHEKIMFDSDVCGLDSSQCNTLYLIYKKRNIVNRVPYMMEWYMDRYEQDTIDDWLKYKPRYVVWGAWGGGPNAVAYRFFQKINQSYTRITDAPGIGWGYYIWKRND